MKNSNAIKKSYKATKTVLAIVLTLVMGLTMLPSSAMAQSDKSIEDIHVSEATYADTMATVVEPYLDSLIQTGYITGKKDATLYYEKYVLADAKGTVVISHGFTETLDKYHEMIYYFLQMGYSVYGMEHRGHARSGRLGIDANQINVEDFEYYVKDLKTFLDEVVVKEATNENLYIFGHSMGGGIATRFLETYSGYFKAAILSSPMLEVNTGTIPAWLAKALAYGASFTSYADDYVLGQGPYTGEYNFEATATSSQARYDYSYNMIAGNEAFQMGGASYRWASQSFYATNRMTCYFNASRVKIPVLIFQAGLDEYVGNDGQNTFAKYAKDCSIIRYDNAKHEIYFERDEIQVDYLNNLFDYLGSK